MWRRAFLAVLLSAVPVLAAGLSLASIEDFAFVQVSDVHVEPHLARTGDPGPLRGGDTIEWICRAAVGPQTIAPFGITTPAPAFGLATGDLTEYGVIDDTWSIFQQAFAPLPYPLYVLPGNHDNTWVAMYHIMREKYGGENYSFDQYGCHFACICSASPQEPVPTIDAKTRAWLKHGLESTAPGTPVFVALHHPPYSDEFAPAEYDTLIDLLRDYNVVLMLYGHGHNVSHRNMDGIDGVMGGSTFGKNAGYAVISMRDGTLRVAYRYHHEPGEGKQAPGGPAWRKLLEKPLTRNTPQRLFSLEGGDLGGRAHGDSLDFTIDVSAGVELAEIRAQIDGKEVEAQRSRAAGFSPRGAGRSGRSKAVAHGLWSVDARGLISGFHLLTVHATSTDGAKDLRTSTFATQDVKEYCVWLKNFDAAVKAGPVVAGDKLIVARTDGAVLALDPTTGDELWSFATGGEILGTPAWTGAALVFGSGDGKVYALDERGELLWSSNAGMPVYGSPLIHGETVYIGDNGGRMHALDVESGKPCWTFERADYAIECRPCVWGDLLVFGAWDGYLYALRRSDGTLAWKAWGPKSSDGQAARYYAPADCGPATLGGTDVAPVTDTLFVCDRGYILGTYDRAGSQGKRLGEGISAIATDFSGRYLYCRSKDDRVCKFNAAGEKLWDKAIPAGRFPIPPTCHKDTVYVCSNRGLLSVLDASDGSVRWQYQVTPGFYVMAPVAVDEEGTCYVAGMDGTITALRAAEPQPPRHQARE
jgi:outer membrane protein assembly factor BamB